VEFELTQKNKTKYDMSFAQIRAQISFNAIVVSIVIFYGVFGAYVFRTFEAQKSALATNNQRENFKEQLLKELWHHKNLEFDEWSTQVRSQLESYEKNLLLETSSSEWSLSDSWLFACSVFTTIGKDEFITSQFYFDSSRLNLSMLYLNSANQLNTLLKLQPPLPPGYPASRVLLVALCSSGRIRACLQGGRVTLARGLPKHSHISSFFLHRVYLGSQGYPGRWVTLSVC